MAKKPYQIKTKRLSIRPLSNTEMERLVLETTDVERKDLYEKRRVVAEESGDDRYWYCVWGIYDRKNGKYLGDFSYLGPMENYEVSFDLYLKEEYRRMGYGKEALRAMMDTALYGDHGIYFVIAETTADNEAMIHVLTELGYTKLTDEGELGPRYEYARPQHSLLSVGIAVGLCFGSAFGVALKNYATGMSLGMCFGVAIGLLFDSGEKKKYNEMRANRI